MTIILENLNGKASLLDIIRERGLPVAAPCGGKGKCGRCKVKANGTEVLACSCFPEGRVEVELRDINEYEIHAGTAAVDLGTSNIVVLLDGKTVIKEPNSQCGYGADVITRLEYIRNEGKLGELHSLVSSQIKRMCCGAEKVYVVGNTVMEHIFAEKDPSSIAVPPFAPADLFRNSSGMAPCVSGYVGGDLVAGLTACGADTAEGLWLYVDIGTNGEMALGNKDGYITCACAAGPAFENGMGGFYGSEIIDLLAGALKKGIVGKSGRVKSDFPLTQQNVRDIQLAKAAIRAGAETLLESAGKSAEDITKLIIAGDFGYHINAENAELIGLLPKAKEIWQPGNSALQGAQIGLYYPEKLLKTAELCRYLDLSSSEVFSELFLKNINFLPI